MTTLRRRLRAILPTPPHRHRPIPAETEVTRAGESGSGWQIERCACKLRRVCQVEGGTIYWTSSWGEFEDVWAEAERWISRPDHLE